MLSNSFYQFQFRFQAPFQYYVLWIFSWYLKNNQSFYKPMSSADVFVKVNCYFSFAINSFKKIDVIFGKNGSLQKFTDVTSSLSDSKDKAI